MSKATTIPKGYRKTEVGVIPEDWGVKKLGEIGKWKSGGTPSMANPAYWGGNLHWVSSGDVKHYRLTGTASTITEKAIQETNTKLLPKGSIITVFRSGILRKYFPVSQLMQPMAINQDIKGLVVPSAICSDWLLASLVWSGPKILRTCLKSGTTVESIEFPWFNSFAIPLPPTLEEQKAIATVLSDTDALIESLQKLIAKKRNIKQGAMQELLTGKRRLPFDSAQGKPGFGKKAGFKQTEVGLIPEDWEVKKLGTLVFEERKIRYGIVQPGNYSHEGRYMVRGQDYSFGWAKPDSLFKVSDEIEQRYKNARLKGGDVIMTIVGASTGHVAIVPEWLEGANITQTTARIGIDESKADAHFCRYFFQTDQGINVIKNFIKGNAQPGLNIRDVEVMQIPLPPTLAEQKAIATVLSDMDAEIEKLETKLEKYRHIKQGMMQELLTGKIRLPGFGPQKGAA